MPNNFAVEKDQKFAGARIISLIIENEKLVQMEKICAEHGPVFEVRPYNKLRVGVVTTGSEIFKKRIDDRFGPVINKKIDYFQAENLGQIICPDNIDEIVNAILKFRENKADLIILTVGCIK